LIATGGGLVFGGGTSDRMFRAFDARTGKVLWEYPTTSGVLGTHRRSPATDVVRRGAVGVGIDARGMQNRLNAIRPGEFPEVPEGGAVRWETDVAPSLAMTSAL
jgi:alcohol dehydrogenase (cytochrome c)